jgi:hypothetical protein
MYFTPALAPVLLLGSAVAPVNITPPVVYGPTVVAAPSTSYHWFHNNGAWHRRYVHRDYQYHYRRGSHYAYHHDAHRGVHHRYVNHHRRVVRRHVAHHHHAAHHHVTHHRRR